MNNLKYILVNKEPVVEPDLYRWGEWFETPGNKIIAFTQLKDCDISTVFLGSDHNFSNEGEPILFETMIFGGQYDQYQERCRTYEAAERGHIMAVQMVINSNLLQEKPDYLC